MTAVLDQPEVEGHRQIVSLSQDSFYRELNDEDLKLAKKGHFNFDHPGKSHKFILIPNVLCVESWPSRATSISAILANSMNLYLFLISKLI